MRCFGDPKDTIDSKQLKNQIYLLRFGHTRALLFKKKGHEMAISPVLGKLTHMCPRTAQGQHEHEWGHLLGA